MDIMEICEQALNRFYKTINYDYFKEYKEVLDRIFGPQRVQIIRPTVEDTIGLHSAGYDISEDEGWMNNLFFTVIIHFPEITITNTRSDQHVIRDLYTRFYLDNQGYMRGSLSGVRGTITKDEYVSQYMHSHLHRTDFYSVYFDDFCLGEGPILQSMALLRNQFDPVNFEIFCYHLINMVSHESLEGTPYVYMENIGIGQGNLNFPILESDFKFTLMEYIQDLLRESENVKEMLDISFEPGCIKVKITEAFGDFVIPLLKVKYLSSSHRFMLSHRSETGLLVPYNSDPTVTGVLRPTPIFIFKEQPIYLKLLNTDTNEQATTAKCWLHPALIQHIENTLSYDFTQAYIAYEKNAGRNNIGNHPTVARPNTVAV